MREESLRASGRQQMPEMRGPAYSSQAEEILDLFARPSTLAVLPHGGDLGVELRPAFRSLRSALLPHSGSSSLQWIGEAVRQVFGERKRGVQGFAGGSDGRVRIGNERQ
jgi:hypothetical protein